MSFNNNFEFDTICGAFNSEVDTTEFCPYFLEKHFFDRDLGSRNSLFSHLWFSLLLLLIFTSYHRPVVGQGKTFHGSVVLRIVWNIESVFRNYFIRFANFISRLDLWDVAVGTQKLIGANMPRNMPLFFGQRCLFATINDVNWNSFEYWNWDRCWDGVEYALGFSPIRTTIWSYWTVSQTTIKSSRSAFASGTICFFPFSLFICGTLLTPSAYNKYNYTFESQDLMILCIRKFTVHCCIYCLIPVARCHNVSLLLVMHTYVFGLFRRLRMLYLNVVCGIWI